MSHGCRKSMYNIPLQAACDSCNNWWLHFGIFIVLKYVEFTKDTLIAPHKV